MSKSVWKIVIEIEGSIVSFKRDKLSEVYARKLYNQIIANNMVLGGITSVELYNEDIQIDYFDRS